MFINFDIDEMNESEIHSLKQDVKKLKLQIEGNKMSKIEDRDNMYKLAKQQTPETIGMFINDVMSMDDIDYGNVIDCIAACAIAGAAAADNHKNGGITGFQAGYVMWQFIRNYMYEHNKCGLRMIDWDNMLYHQDESSFDKVIPQNVFERLQNQAKEEIQIKWLSEKQKQHLQNIIDGIPPFGYSIKPKE